MDKSMKLSLHRPLVVFDLETTGLSLRQDRIIQISAVKLLPDGTREARNRYLNPEIPIPAEVTALHGIRDEDVADAPTFRQVAKGLLAFLEHCDLAGFSIVRFDIPILVREFARCNIQFDVRSRKILDAQKIFFAREPRTLEAALRFYCNQEHTASHDAGADVEATIQVLEGQLDRYEDLPHTPDELHDLFNPIDSRFVDWEGRLQWRDREVVIGFGKKSGTPLRTLVKSDADYLHWILRGDFTQEVKSIVRNALKGKYPDPPPMPASSASQSTNQPAQEETSDAPSS